MYHLSQLKVLLRSGFHVVVHAGWSLWTRPRPSYITVLDLVVCFQFCCESKGGHSES